MKIRMTGSPDLIRSWAKELERAYGIRGMEYPMKAGEIDLRVYLNINDHKAAEILNKTQHKLWQWPKDIQHKWMKHGASELCIFCGTQRYEGDYDKNSQICSGPVEVKKRNA